MLQIQDTLVSLDVLTEKFVCNLDTCKGACCIEGDAGAPVSLDEVAQLEEVLPVVWKQLSEEAKAVIQQQGVAYADPQGDLVTSIVNGRDCVFCQHEGGCTFCAIERAFRQGKTNINKPMSCHLYPIRLKPCGIYTAVNYERWNICQSAVELGKKLGMPVYKFLKEPLIRRFGSEWYEELELTANEMQSQGLL